MTRRIGLWPWRAGYLPLWLGLLLFLFYVVVLGLAVTGHSRDFNGMSWFLIWTPIWIGQLFVPNRSHPYHHQPLPDDAEPPEIGSGALGICAALAAFGALLLWTQLAGAREFVLPFASEPDWVVNGIVLVLGAFVFAVVPLSAIRAHGYYAAQSPRLVAAESARATARAQVLQSQMQPHFLFNALNTITALMREDPVRGREVLLRLRGLLERSLTTIQRPMISLQDEVAFVRDQLAIEQERFRDRLTVTFDVDPELLAHRVPAFCIQPLVENALRHGIGRSLDGGAIHVRASRHSPAAGTPGAAALRIEVQDTGAGLAPGWREGTGLSNLRQRLSAAYGPTATLTVTSDVGHTSAVVTVPVFGGHGLQPVPTALMRAAAPGPRARWRASPTRSR